MSDSSSVNSTSKNKNDHNLASKFVNGVIPPPPSVPPPAYLLEEKVDLQEKINFDSLQQRSEVESQSESSDSYSPPCSKKNEGTFFNGKSDANSIKKSTNIKTVDASKIIQREAEKGRRVNDKSIHENIHFSVGHASSSEFTETFTESEAGYSDLLKASRGDEQLLSEIGPERCQSQTTRQRNGTVKDDIEKIIGIRETAYHYQTSNGGKQRTKIAILGDFHDDQERKTREDKIFSDLQSLEDDDLHQQLKGIFAALDKNSDGYLCRPQITLAFQFLGIMPTNDNLNYLLHGKCGEKLVEQEGSKNVDKKKLSKQKKKQKRPKDAIDRSDFIFRMSIVVNNDGLVPSSSSHQFSKSKKQDSSNATNGKMAAQTKPADIVEKSILELFSAFDEKDQGKISLKDLRHIMTETMISDAFSRGEFEDFLKCSKLYTSSTASSKERKKKNEKENAKLKLVGIDQARLMTRQAEEENTMIDYMTLIKNMKAGKPMLCL